MKRTMLIGITLIIILFTPMANSESLHPEKWYQERWCKANGGEIEKVLPDKTRCDCVTETNAIEVDFGDRWHSAVGQALWYAIQTGKKAGIVLIVETDKDSKYWIKLNALVSKYRLPIDTWKTAP